MLEISFGDESKPNYSTMVLVDKPPSSYWIEINHSHENPPLIMTALETWGISWIFHIIATYWDHGQVFDIGDGIVIPPTTPLSWAREHHSCGATFQHRTFAPPSTTQDNLGPKVTGDTKSPGSRDTQQIHSTANDGSSW